MARILLPLLTALLLAAPADAQVLSGVKDDPAERVDDPGRDIQSISSTYDPDGIWTARARFYGAPTAETSALMRVFLGTLAEDGSCRQNEPAILMAAYTDPADRGGKGFVDNMSVNLVKTNDEDGRGFTLTFSDSRLAQRGVCGIDSVTLSRREPFDRVGAFQFPGAPSEPPPPPPAPNTDTTAPTATMRVLRDPKAARRGIVRISVLAASEHILARATLYGTGGEVQSRQAKPLAPNQMVTLTLRLRARQLRQLRRTGRLPVEVVALLVDDAGNQAHLRKRTTLRYRR
jgi:hypothetical protein